MSYFKKHDVKNKKHKPMYIWERSGVRQSATLIFSYTYTNFYFTFILKQVVKIIS